MLIFPSLLFGIMIYLGSEHGDDRCPLDLDALLVWFGALGMAVLVMDCANDGPFDLLEWNDCQMGCPLWCSTGWEDVVTGLTSDILQVSGFHLVVLSYQFKRVVRSTWS